MLAISIAACEKLSLVGVVFQCRRHRKRHGFRSHARPSLPATAGCYDFGWPTSRPQSKSTDRFRGERSVDGHDTALQGAFASQFLKSTLAPAAGKQGQNYT